MPHERLPSLARGIGVLPRRISFDDKRAVPQLDQMNNGQRSTNNFFIRTKKMELVIFRFPLSAFRFSLPPFSQSVMHARTEAFPGRDLPRDFFDVCKLVLLRTHPIQR